MYGCKSKKKVLYIAAEVLLKFLERIEKREKF
jgi:hypothetical protein